jgi:NADPH-dependent glutamate synthase beta subunit-like oxidoreductase
MGHQVDIYDRESRPGGMLRYGIPDYRLPHDVIDREISTLEKMGIDFHLNSKINTAADIEKLQLNDHDAILIAFGVSASKNLPIEGIDLDGIYLGLDFLKAAKTESKPELAGKVTVIGGGNVAIDAAMTAMRLGAESVQLFCLESRKEMPAHEWEIAQAEEEGVTINCSWGPQRFLSDNGRISGIEFIKCTEVFDGQGRFAPKYDESETRQIGAETAIVTIGQKVENGLFDLWDGLSENPDGTLKADKDFLTGVEKVFASGDLIRGPSSVIDAIADGRKVADTIDKFMGGKGIIESFPEETGEIGAVSKVSNEVFQLSRQAAQSADPDKRKLGFGLIEETYSEKTAISEASRCLQCHIRKSITPVVLPPEKWLSLNTETVNAVPETEGVFQLLDNDKNVIRISGTANLRSSLNECLENPNEAVYFTLEEDPMFTKRESEVIQQYLQKHGQLPGAGGDDDLDDLF